MLTVLELALVAFAGTFAALGLVYVFSALLNLIGRHR